MIRIGVLVSGDGTNLQSIIDACSSGDIHGSIAVVISNRSGVKAIERAESAGISTRVILAGSYPERLSFDMEVAHALDGYDVDLVVLAGYMRILSPEFIRKYSGRIMNIHPSLLPSFPGLDVRQKAIDYGVRFSGCTVHFVDEGVDTGPIIIQGVCPVFPDDSEELLKERILSVEHRIYPKAIDLFALGRLRIDGRKVLVDGMDAGGTSSMINPPLDD